ncbi:short-chain dehydrogenase [Bacterioplanes sanyensis]|uniref:Short-chain dehydrogenase n=1 Tax=Bacterioplanes sanyensis TaxID=1249553 RepID=A0A222FKS7_9GAMM|nr:SDR family oxidoreductase [Bacterioplanes sanyensis]ASP39359.1 short-chain dehydrogenase [Bacterioplanes sanyensis]
MANIVITGANRGIGLALAQQLAARGDRITAICRDSSDELEQVCDQIITGIDVTDEASLAGLATVLTEMLDGSVDVLINNAGVFHNESLTQWDADSVRQQFEVNSLAPIALTVQLKPLLSQGSKVINITSRMGSISDNTSGQYYGYRASKAALNAMSKSLALDLHAEGIAVAVLHPGFVQTRMVGFNGDVTPEQSAEGLIARIDGLTLENTGSFWHASGDLLPW